MRLRPVTLLILLALVSCGPIPGSSLAGQDAAIPSEWSEVIDEGHATCEVESRPDEPHSIQLDCFIHEDALYVQSHRWALSSWWPVQSWAAIWIEHPAVRVRIGESLFDLRAIQVTDEQARTKILTFRGYDPIPEGVVLFRFDSR